MTPKKKAALGIFGAALVHGLLIVWFQGNAAGFVAPAVGVAIGLTLVSSLFLLKSPKAAWICLAVLVSLSWISALSGQFARGSLG